MNAPQKKLKLIMEFPIPPTTVTDAITGAFSAALVTEKAIMKDKPQISSAGSAEIYRATPKRNAQP